MDGSTRSDGGRRGRRLRGAVLILLAAASIMVLAGTADAGNGHGKFGKDPFGNGHFTLTAFVPQSLQDAIVQNPSALYDVIVQSADGRASAKVAHAVQQAQQKEGGTGLGHIRDRFASVSGVSAGLTGWQILRLAGMPGILSISPDEAVDAIDPATTPASSGYQDAETWRQSVDAAGLSGSSRLAPAIAVVDSGIDATKTADFGSRVIASVTLSTLSHGAAGDQEGHGTMVAGLAAGSSATYPGVAPTAPLIDVKTADAEGESLTSDVIEACDWILQNKDRYGIRVANFSLVSAPTSSFAVDPLDRAVEKLWLNGIVVVAAVGNYGQPGVPVDVSHAPGNDPFVITVGALDQDGTASAADDTAAPWSAFGQTDDGFSKPDVGAPGRYLIAPVPAGAYLSSVVPDRVVAPGYMWMSGTSFAAPIVAGAAAQILAQHPGWVPDQVKGALLQTAQAVPAAGPAAGAGEIDVAAAAAAANPSNPNAAVDAYVVTDPSTGLLRFDTVSWLQATAPGVLGGYSGSSANDTASWTSASWSSASWSSASWSSSIWSAASWSSASWSSASWSALDWLP